MDNDGFIVPEFEMSDDEKKRLREMVAKLWDFSFKIGKDRPSLMKGIAQYRMGIAIEDMEA